MKIDIISTGLGTPSNHTLRFSPPIILDQQKKFEVALLSLAHFNELPNISGTIFGTGNNTFRYYNGSSFSSVITIPTGIYSVEELNTEINRLISLDGGTANNILLIPNYSTLKVDIELKNNYQLDLSTSNLYKTIGWTSQIVSTQGLNAGINLADISNGVTNYVVHCSIVSAIESYSNGEQSDSLYSYAPNVSPGSLIEIIPFNLYHIGTNTNTINSINIRLTDQNGTELQDLVSPVRISLSIQEKVV